MGILIFHGNYMYKAVWFVTNNYNSEAVYTALNTFLQRSSLLVKKTCCGCWEPYILGLDVRNNRKHILFIYKSVCIYIICLQERK